MTLQNFLSHSKWGVNRHNTGSADSRSDEHPWLVYPVDSGNRLIYQISREWRVWRQNTNQWSVYRLVYSFALICEKSPANRTFQSVFAYRCHCNRRFGSSGALAHFHPLGYSLCCHHQRAHLPLSHTASHKGVHQEFKYIFHTTFGPLQYFYKYITCFKATWSTQL
jgi:hypothetical protein